MARTSRSSSGDDSVSDEDRSKASAAYKSVGISLYNDKGEYKDYSETLDELSAKWDKLTDAQRNYMNCYIFSKSFGMEYIIRVLYW